MEKKYNTGYYIRAAAIQEITRQHYEPERQDRCYKWVWRKYIRPMYGITYISYLKYIKAEIPKEEQATAASDKFKQLTLFDNKDGK